MDLNNLYFQHQLSLMRAGSAADRGASARHSGVARGIAQQICNLQLALGAGAAHSWCREPAR